MKGGSVSISTIIKPLAIPVLYTVLYVHGMAAASHVVNLFLDTITTALFSHKTHLPNM